MRFTFIFPRLAAVSVCLAAFLTGSRAETDPTSKENSAKALAELKAWLGQPREKRTDLTASEFAGVALTKEAAAVAKAALWKDHEAFIRETRAAEMKAKVIEWKEKKMRFDTVEFKGRNPDAKKGRSLFISMHGGGGAPEKVNTQQWENQIKLAKAYKPAEGIYVAPRAPTDNWNLWHEGHIDPLFDRLIENMIVLNGVNPNRIYILGYSAGGDGVYQLGPRMADRWAAAAMMAGHPNEAKAEGLRNVPFAIQVGANDGGYKRNEVAAEWGKKLDALRQADPGGYEHFTELHAGKGHWMDLEDKKAIPWMEKFSRNPLPDRIVWRQDDVTHERFYWLALPKKAAAGQQIVATHSGQTFTVTSREVKTVTVLLNDDLANLDEAVIVSNGAKELSSERAQRTIGMLQKTLLDRGDPELMFSAAVTVDLF